MLAMPRPKSKPTGISYLCPLPRDKEGKARRAAVRPVLNEIIIQAAANYRSSDLLMEIYMAGLWHGSELMRLTTGMTIEDYLSKKES